MDVIGFAPEYLPGSEFMALLFHVERSLRYGKQSDVTSLTQMAEGIFDKKNRAFIRGGSGLARSTAAAANAALVQRGLLSSKKRFNTETQGQAANRYSVVWSNL